MTNGDSEKSVEDYGRRRVPLLGIGVTPFTAAQVGNLIQTCPDKRLLIVGHNLHSTYLLRKDRLFAEVYERADITLIDGQPVRLLCGFGESGRPSSEYRVGSVDWLSTVGRSWKVDRIAVIGASILSNSRTVAHLTRMSGSTVRGWHGEQWSESRAQQVIEELAIYRPSLTIVGLGMPLQEHFFHEYENLLPQAPVALVGGAIDQLSGWQVRAPDWIGKLGLEWLWRLSRDPRRLGHRYLVEPLLLAGEIVREKWQLTR